MNRREALEAFGASLGAGCVLKEVPREPEPLFFALTSAEEIPLRDLDHLTLGWEKLRQVIPGLGWLVILPPGSKLEPCVDPRKFQASPEGEPIPRWAFDRINKVWAERYARFDPPNPQQTCSEMRTTLARLLAREGSVLVWRQPNLNMLNEEMSKPSLWAIPTSVAIPQPAVVPEYPEGHYRFWQMNGEGLKIDSAWKDVPRVDHQVTMLPWEVVDRIMKEDTSDAVGLNRKAV